MAIFNSYVKLPEGNFWGAPHCKWLEPSKIKKTGLSLLTLLIHLRGHRDLAIGCGYMVGEIIQNDTEYWNMGIGTW